MGLVAEPCREHRGHGVGAHRGALAESAKVVVTDTINGLVFVVLRRHLHRGGVMDHHRQPSGRTLGVERGDKTDRIVRGLGLGYGEHNKADW